MKIPVKKKLVGFTLLLGVLGLALASCGSDGDDDSAKTESPLKIGAILPQTGSIASFGPPTLTAAEMAVAEIQAAGGRVELLTRDSGTNVEIANAAANNLIGLGVDAILGAVASGVSSGIIDTVVGSGILMMSPGNSAASFSTYDDNGLYFRTAASLTLWAEATADRVRDQGAESVVIINRDDTFGIEFAEAVEGDLETFGLTVLQTFEYGSDDTSDFSSISRQVAAIDPDAIVLVSFDETVELLQELLATGLNPQNTLFMLSALVEDNLGEMVNPENPGILEGVEDLDIAPLPDGEPTFLSRYMEFAPNALVHPYIYSTYDAVVILALAALEADSTDPEDIAREINDITRGGTECQLYSQCAQMIEDGQNILYNGAGGALKFREVGEPTSAAYDFFTYDSQGRRQVSAERLVIVDAE